MAEKKKPAKRKAMTDEEISVLTFEEALDRLESLVAELQADSAGLDEAFGLWEEGQRLHQHCRNRLDEIAQRLQEHEQE
ncbi:MAG: exodeoxyribonuclease VII small subunit [Acidobacteria bacterium]|nr:MAG: exodeoxyribonuclease VII small subunit [Acidobacteriota bacterium]